MKLSRLEALDIIGVCAESSDVEVKTAYKKLALQWHPDKNGGSAESTAKFKQINAAYSRLQAKDDETSDEEDYGMEDEEIIPFDELMDFLFLRMFMKGGSRGGRDNFFGSSFSFQPTGFGSGTPLRRPGPFSFGNSGMRRGPSPGNESPDSEEEDDTWMYRRRERSSDAERERTESEARRRAEEEAGAKKKREEEEVQRKAEVKARYEAEEAEKRRKKQEKARNKQKQVFGGTESAVGEGRHGKKSAKPSSSAHNAHAATAQGSSIAAASQSARPLPGSSKGTDDSGAPAAEGEKKTESRAAPAAQEAEIRPKKQARSSRKEKASSAVQEAVVEDSGAQGETNSFTALDAEEPALKARGRSASRSARRSKAAEVRVAPQSQGEAETEGKKSSSSQSTRGPEARAAPGGATAVAGLQSQTAVQEEISERGQGDAGVPPEGLEQDEAAKAGRVAAADAELKRRQERLDEEMARRLQAEEDMEAARNPRGAPPLHGRDGRGSFASELPSPGIPSISLQTKMPATPPIADSRPDMSKSRSSLRDSGQANPATPARQSPAEASSSFTKAGATGNRGVPAAASPAPIQPGTGRRDSANRHPSVPRKSEQSKLSPSDMARIVLDSKEWQLEMERLEAGRKLDEQRQQQVLEQRLRKEELERAEQERRRRSEAKLIEKTAAKVQGAGAKKKKKKKGKDKEEAGVRKEHNSAEEQAGSAQGDSASDGRLTSGSRSSSEAGEVVFERSQSGGMSHPRGGSTDLYAPGTLLHAGQHSEFSAPAAGVSSRPPLRGFKGEVPPSQGSVGLTISSTPGVVSARGHSTLGRSMSQDRSPDLTRVPVEAMESPLEGGQPSGGPRPYRLDWQSAGQQAQQAWSGGKGDPKQWKDIVQEEIWEEWPEEEFEPYKVLAEVPVGVGGASSSEAPQERQLSQDGEEAKSVAQSGRVEARGEGVAGKAGGWMRAEDLERELYSKAEQEPPANDTEAEAWDLTTILRDIQKRAAEVAQLPLSEDYSRTSPTSPLEATCALSESGPPQKPYTMQQMSFLPKYCPPLSVPEPTNGTVPDGQLQSNGMQFTPQRQNASPPPVTTSLVSNGSGGADGRLRPAGMSQLSASGRPFVPAAYRPPIHSPATPPAGNGPVAPSAQPGEKATDGGHGVESSEAGGRPAGEEPRATPTSPLEHMGLKLTPAVTSPAWPPASVGASHGRNQNCGVESAVEAVLQQPQAPLPYLTGLPMGYPGAGQLGVPRGEQSQGLAPVQAEGQGQLVPQTLTSSHTQMYPHHLPDPALFPSPVPVPVGAYIPSSALQAQYMMAGYPLYPAQYAGQLEVAYGVPYMHPMPPFYPVSGGYMLDQNGLVVGQPYGQGLVHAEGPSGMEQAEGAQQWEPREVNAPAQEPRGSGVHLVQRGEEYGSGPAHLYPEEQEAVHGHQALQVLQFGEHIAQIPGTAGLPLAAVSGLKTETAELEGPSMRGERMEGEAPHEEGPGGQEEAFREAVPKEQDGEGQGSSFWPSSAQAWGSEVLVEQAEGDHSEAFLQMEQQEGVSSQHYSYGAGEVDQAGVGTVDGSWDRGTGSVVKTGGAEEWQDRWHGWEGQGGEAFTRQASSSAGEHFSSEQESEGEQRARDMGEEMRTQPEASSLSEDFRENAFSQTAAENSQRLRGSERQKAYGGHQVERSRQQPRASRGGGSDPHNSPLCSFFQRGICRFGDKCRFSHVTSADQQHPGVLNTSSTEAQTQPLVQSPATGQAWPQSRQHEERSGGGQREKHRIERDQPAAGNAHTAAPSYPWNEGNKLAASVPPPKPSISGASVGGYGRTMKDWQGGRQGRGPKGQGYWRPRGPHPGNPPLIAELPAMHATG